jgi:hypothetical protein
MLTNSVNFYIFCTVLFDMFSHLLEPREPSQFPWLSFLAIRATRDPIGAALQGLCDPTDTQAATF